ncbi:hypothetical protein MMC07_000972 [Pseudocyphellaria aurata]|nr:hypothetical protein [Pseudocyphellaria aurata]
MGEAVRRSGIPRNEVFLTTKILSPAGSPEETYQKCLQSVKQIDEGENGYVDLFLIHSHSPGPAKRKEMWGALERLYEEGRAKAIGVSNFGVGHVEDLKEGAKIWPPHVNQLELHPWSQQRTIVSYCSAHSIIVEAYSPIVRNQKSQDSTLVSLARKYSKTTSQILVRWSLQKGWVPLPKSDTKSRIEENRDVFGWEIESGDMQVLDDLDEGEKGAIVKAVKNDTVQ